ncbi:MAG: class I SAM-dependent methyltransferase [Kiritimatiellae bacterium]|nr:class I SAM-dependent methyltransferase [Kiritimatiellia bacterium]
MTAVFLKKGRDHSVRNHHPWIFSGAIDRLEGEAAPGDIVLVRDAAGEALGLGSYSPASQIRIRMLAFDPKAGIDDLFFADALGRALRARERLLKTGAVNALRVVNAEADLLPGVTVDRYGDWYVGQFTTAGAERRKEMIATILLNLWPAKGFFERSDADSRQHEGLPASSGVLAGEEPPETIEIAENGCRYLVDVRAGHKTGFYLDQRDNRAAVAAYAAGRDVLNVFSYTGGFGVAALAAGAKSVTNVDISAPALELAKRNFALNGLPDVAEFIEGNAFEVLRKFRDSRRSFDLVVLDPPKFADNKNRVMGALRGYKDLNLLAMKLLAPGGYLATFSCSGLVTPELFRKVVGEAAVDAKRDFQIVRSLRQATDHPESVFFPEGLYLKGLILRANP